MNSSGVELTLAVFLCFLGFLFCFAARDAPESLVTIYLSAVVKLLSTREAGDSIQPGEALRAQPRSIAIKCCNPEAVI